MNSSHNLGNFPTDLLEKIFLNVGEDALCNNIPRVCKKWRLVSSLCSSLMKSANFDGNSVLPKDICFSMQNASQLKSISFVSVNNIVPVIRQMCRSNKEVESVQIKNCSSDGDFIQESVFINFLLSLKNLSSIQISGTKFHSPLFYEVLATMTNVTSIDFSANDFISITDLLMIVHNCKIKEFKMSRRSPQVAISCEEMSYLIATMSQCLVLLHLDMSGFGNSTFNVICNCFKLKDLTLNNARNLTADILSKLSKLSNLVCLKIESPSLLRPDDIFKSLFENSTISGQLVVLELESFDCLCNPECSLILEVCNKLKSLSLQACKSITVGGISSALSLNANLECLNIANIGCLKGIELVVEKLELLTLVIDSDSFNFYNLYGLTKNLNVKLINKDLSRKDLKTTTY